MGKAINYIGIARKGGAIEMGEMKVKALVKAGRARLLLLAADASAQAQRRAEGYVYGFSVPVLRGPYSKEELSRISGKAGCSMAAFLDRGLAASFAHSLFQEYGDADWGAAAQSLKPQGEKNAGDAVGKTKKTGKRRKSV